ncbi:MAG TPA: RusA family crossover junction endodeoxyribonuclease [Anaerovoracaceae bacterium]|nr:RusA family crossover junction endodeoxyribonuclease [Anaerovoracaceae bacterium]
MIFTIPYPRTKSGMKEFCKRFGMNSLYSGKHWSQRREDAEYIHNTVRAALMEQRIPRKIFQNPVRITFFWNDRLDIDNHAYLQKCIIDAMKGYLIQDDDRRFAREVTSKFYDEPCITVEVKPYET